MPHDQLVQFAARKVGKPTMECAGVCYIVDGTLHGQPVLIDVNSPDLMLKGMGVMEQEDVQWVFSRLKFEMWRQYSRGSAFVRLESIQDLPHTFWECWYQLEKGMM